MADDVDDPEVDGALVERDRGGALRVIVVSLSAVVLLAGLVLGGIGVQRLSDASDTQAEMDEVEASVVSLEDLQDEQARDHARLERRVAVAGSAFVRVDHQAAALREFTNDVRLQDQLPLRALDRAIIRSNGGDPTGAGQQASDEVPPLLAAISRLLDEEDAAQARLPPSLARLIEVLT